MVESGRVTNQERSRKADRGDGDDGRHDCDDNK